MPFATELKKPAYTIVFVGPPHSGKTRAALSFPRVMAITFDPTGLDLVFDPENEKLRENLVFHVPLNGIPIEDVFKVTEEPGETSLYGALALAKKLKAENKIDTVFLDGGSYMADLKQEHVADDKDTRAMYRQLGGYLSAFYLQNFLPLATRHGLNVLCAIHLQRESRDAVEGVSDPSSKVYGTSKPLINQNSDISPQIVGGFRQKIAGMPSAVIYLSCRLESDKDGKEVRNYYAYCQPTHVKEWDSDCLAKNRYGLPARLKMTNGSFWKTLQARLTVNTKPQPAETDTATKVETESSTTTTTTPTVKEKK